MNAKVFSRAAFHGAVNLSNLFAMIASLHMPHFPYKHIHHRWGGFWKYLTYWNFVVLALYFVLSFCIDFMKTSSSNYHTFTKIRDKIYAGVVFPYSMFVVAAFWILYLIDRELILPKEMDAVFPLWLNHMTHTFIMPLLLLETYISRHRYPARKEGLKITAAFGITYITWMLYLVQVKNIWPYPVLEILNNGQRGLFFASSVVMIFFAYLVGEKLNTFCRGDRIASKSK